MSTQIPDFFAYQGNPYNLVGISLHGKGLLLPQHFEMFPRNFSTACMRGYYFKYTCADNSLIIDTLSFCLDHIKDYKKINGISPVGDTEHFFDADTGKFCLYKYENLKIAVPYSGGFLIARKFLQEINVEEIPQSYETILELLFNNGRLERVINWSNEVAVERKEALIHKPKAPHYKVEFSLKYDHFYTWPGHMDSYSK